VSWVRHIKRQIKPHFHQFWAGTQPEWLVAQNLEVAPPCFHEFSSIFLILSLLQYTDTYEKNPVKSHVI
jgi:hypothetical protein